MRIVIVGAGATGIELARRLSAKNQVFVVEAQPEHLEKLGTPINLLAGQASQPIPDPAPGIVPVFGDGTSRLLLDALHDKDARCALVALSGRDESNIETSRLAISLGFDPVMALMHDLDQEEVYTKERIVVLDRPRILADQIERTLRARGSSIPCGVGLGRGEMLEIRLLATSPVVGLPLKNLAPFQWRVAAVFRGDQVIVPTGDTVLAEHDRVLLVGDPNILPAVAEYLRLGTPQFPRPFGPHVLTIEPGKELPKLAEEAEYLARTTKATGFFRGFSKTEPQAEPQVNGQDEPGIESEVFKQGTFSLPAPDADPLATQRIYQRQRPGTVVATPGSRALLARFLGRRGADADLCDNVSAPVLFARGKHPYKRILLTVSSSAVNLRAAEMAIDLTRQLGARLTAINVDLPKVISGLSEEDIHSEVVPIRRLCELYEVPLDYRHQLGNPIEHIVDESRHHDLVILVRRHQRNDSYFDPDVALRVARLAKCSALVLTLKTQE